MRRYRLAEAADYKRCHALMARVDVPTQRLSWPTVMMEQDGEVLAFLSTRPTKTALIAGPLVVDKEKGSGFIVMRLVEAYERLLQRAHVESYLFFVDQENDWWQGLVQKCLDGQALAEYVKGDARTWYIRRFNHGWRRTISSRAERGRESITAAAS